MRTSTLTVALVSVLLVAGAGTAGALTTTGPLLPQESPAGTTAAGSTAETTAGSGSATTGGAGSAASASVTFDDQNSSGESVLVQTATLQQDGFVAIYDSTRSGNETDQIIGVSYPLSAGTSDNIRIQLDEPVNTSKSLTAVIHADSNGNDEFDFASSGGQQDPAPPEGDQRIVDIAQITVEGGASDTGGTETGGATDAGSTAGEETTAQSGADGTDGGSGTTAAGGEGGDGGSGAFGPGFGSAVAVVALLAVALLAARRN